MYLDHRLPVSPLLGGGGGGGGGGGEGGGCPSNLYTFCVVP